MSLDDHKGSAYFIRELMRSVQSEIDAKERKGVTKLYSRSGGKSLWERIAMRRRSLIPFGRKRA